MATANPPRSLVQSPEESDEEDDFLNDAPPFNLGKFLRKKGLLSQAAFANLVLDPELPVHQVGAFPPHEPLALMGRGLGQGAGQRFEGLIWFRG